MVKPEILNENPVSLIETKSELENIKKRDKELNFRSQKTEEYINQFVKHDAKVYAEIKKKIESLKISRLKPEMLVKILDLLPVTADELKAILQEFIVALTNEDIKKIIKVIKETAPAE